MLLSSLPDMVRNAKSRKTRFLYYYTTKARNNQEAICKLFVYSSPRMNRFAVLYYTMKQKCLLHANSICIGQVAVVVGAGNFWRGRNGNEMEQFRADNMGMMATMMNVLSMTFKSRRRSSA